MMLSIGGIFFISLLILNVNTSTGNRIIEVSSNEAVIQATALAEGLFEEISSRAFDEKTVSKSVRTASLLTNNNFLGTETGESSINTFDDIDDYDNITGTDSLSGMGNFDYRIDVYYVEEDSPGTDSNNKTFLKRIRIAIENQYLPVTLIFYRLISY